MLKPYKTAVLRVPQKGGKINVKRPSLTYIGTITQSSRRLKGLKRVTCCTLQSSHVSNLLLSAVGFSFAAYISLFQLVDTASAIANAEQLSQQASSPLPPFPTEFPSLAAIEELPIKEKQMSGQPSGKRFASFGCKLNAKQVMLSNGLKVYMIEDHEVPIVKISLATRGGQHASPEDKVGIASIAAGVQRGGGSEQHPSQILNEDLELLAASIEAAALPEAHVLGMQCLTEDADRVLGLMTELLLSPLLPDDKIQLSKSKILNLLDHQNDSARSIPRRELGKLIYGPDSIYARTPTPEQVKSISRQDVKDYLETWVRPEGAVLGVLGDFETKDMAALLEEKLGKWQGDSRKPRPEIRRETPEETSAGRKLYLIDRPGATQASVAMGEIGVQLSDPDTPALDILNEILNSFGGRLFNEIRSKEGLAYSVSGGFTTAVDHKGIFIAGGETAAVGDFISALERVLQEASILPPTSEVLKAAKAKALNSFVFNFSSSEAQLQRLMFYSLAGLPQDYLFTYKDKVQAVTAEEVLEAAKRHLHPLEQQVVVVADASLNREQLMMQARDVVPLKLS